MNIRCTVAIQKEEDWYVAKSLETSVVSQGETVDSALANLQEALALYFEDYSEPITNEPIFITNLEFAV